MFRSLPLFLLFACWTAIAAAQVYWEPTQPDTLPECSAMGPNGTDCR